MSSASRRQGSRHSRARSASNISFRSSRSSPYRSAAQQTSDTGHRSPKRQRSSSPAHPSSARSPSPSPSRPATRKRFGLNVPTSQPRFVGKFDFEEKYREDPINEEMESNARVWRAFLDECEAFDADMVAEARDGLDLHLVFAGLFSAVLTTFVAQTSQALSTNFPALSASLLIEIVALQRAGGNNTSFDTIPSSSTTSGPSSFDIWVNALWFTSLALSLGTALITVLVKQWLYQYMSMISGTARDRSLIRHYRFEGLQRWHVLTIIGILPIILHVALGLFLAGLVVFLIPLNVPLASIMGFITAIIYMMYVVSNILPLIYTHCPYRTPFSDILNIVTYSIRTLPALARARMHKLFPSSGEINGRKSPPRPFRTLKKFERIAATGSTAEDVACRALLWLYQMTSNLQTMKVIEDSLGCLSDALSKRLIADIYRRVKWVLSGMTQLDHAGRRSFISGQERRAERLLRGPTEYVWSLDRWKLDPKTFELPFQMLAALLTHYSDIVVEMDSQIWNCDRLLVHLIRQHLDERPIPLPLVLWERLISSRYSDGVPQLTGIEDDMFLLPLCNLALNNFSTTARVPTPFSGPVSITNGAVPLFQFVIDLMATRLENVPVTITLDSKPLTKLFIIHDYAVSRLPCLLPIEGSHPAISVISNSWSQILWVPGISESDKHALCQQAENIILQNFKTLEGGWYSDNTLDYYTDVIHAYLRLCRSHAASPEFFERILSDFCSSLKIIPSIPLTLFATMILKKSFEQPTNISVYCSLLRTSPFLSTQTQTSLSASREFLYPVVATFVSCLAGDVDMPRETALQYLDDLSADPQRLYTICRVIALGGNWFNYKRIQESHELMEELRQHLRRLVCVDPTHAVWTQRAHYMSMDPRDWPYIHLADKEMDDETKIEDVRGCMKNGLAILDEFFVSVDLSSSGAQTISPSRSILSPWERIRCFVSDIGRELRFHAPPSNVADMELGLRPSGRVLPNGSVHSHHVDDASRHTPHSQASLAASFPPSSSHSNVAIISG